MFFNLLSHKAPDYNLGMVSLPNLISFLRFPLALCFLSDDLWIRFGVVLCAMLTDWLDGYLARKYRLTSQLGAILDPLADKFFVGFVLIVLISEQKMSYIDAAAMLSRDISVFLFSGYLLATGLLKSYRVESIWSGKVATTLQFFVFIAILFDTPLPASTSILFLGLGVCALLELTRRIPA